MLTLSHPWLLCLWPLPIFIWMLPPIQAVLPAALKVPFFNGLYERFERQQTVATAAHSVLLWVLIWSLLILAVAGPRWLGDARPLQREGRNLMLAMDLSGSMEIEDMLLNGRPVNRLVVVKNAADRFVRQRAGDRIGLILFGSRAYLQTPLTYDRKTVLTRLQDASIGLAGKTTAIGDAIGLAIKRLQNVPREGRVLILLTDGANNAGLLEPLNAAEMAKKEGIKIYTIGLGSVGPQRHSPFVYGPNPSADLDENTLKKIAAITHGRYFRATNPAALQRIYEIINAIEPIRQDEAVARPQVDYYPWLTGLALLLIGGWLFYHSGRLHRREFSLQQGEAHE